MKIEIDLRFRLSKWFDNFKEWWIWFWDNPKFRVFRLFVHEWDDEKILRHWINKEFAIIGEKHPPGYRDWFDYLLKTKDDDWYRKYHFKTVEQEFEMKKYYYKIYYQNVSYAFEDDNPLSYENFYGSWENTSTTFKPINNLSVEDSFRIVGNPRNEKQDYGKPFPRQYTDKDIKEGIEIVVINGLKEGININIISQITKLSIKDIEKIKVKLNL